jgi:hypothetical protein
MVGPKAVPTGVTITPNADKSVYDFQNLGLLYCSGMMPNARALYDPAFNAPSAPVMPSINTYSTPMFLAPDSGGQVYSSYLYNPRVVNAAGYLAGNSKDPATLRLMPKQTMARHKLFLMDYVQTPDLGTPTAFDAKTFAHYPAKGFSVLFADGGAKFISSTLALNIVLSGTFTTAQTLQSVTDYDKLFDALETSE